MYLILDGGSGRYCATAVVDGDCWLKQRHFNDWVSDVKRCYEEYFRMRKCICFCSGALYL